MTVGSGQFDRQGNTVTIANQVAFTATLSPICWIWPSQPPPKPRVPNSCQPRHATSRSGHHLKASPAMRNRSNPKFRPAASLATVASRSWRSRNPVLLAAFAREYTTEHENSAREASPVCQARSPTLRLGRRNWQKRFDQLPQRIRNEHASHVKVLRTAIECRSCCRAARGFCYSL